MHLRRTKTKQTSLTIILRVLLACLTADDMRLRRPETNKKTLAIVIIIVIDHLMRSLMLIRCAYIPLLLDLRILRMLIRRAYTSLLLVP